MMEYVSPYCVSVCVESIFVPWLQLLATANNSGSFPRNGSVFGICVCCVGVFYDELDHCYHVCFVRLILFSRLHPTDCRSTFTIFSIVVCVIGFVVMMGWKDPLHQDDADKRAADLSGEQMQK